MPDQWLLDTAKIPGVDLTNQYLPVVFDIAFSLIKLAMIHVGHHRKFVDVETKFIHGEPVEEIHMQC